MVHLLNSSKVRICTDELRVKTKNLTVVTAQREDVFCDAIERCHRNVLKIPAIIHVFKMLVIPDSL